LWKKITEEDRTEIVKRVCEQRLQRLKIKSIIWYGVISIILGVFVSLFITAALILPDRYGRGYAMFSLEEMIPKFSYILGFSILFIFILFFLYIVRILYLDKTGKLEEVIRKKNCTAKGKICLKCDSVYKHKKSICPKCNCPLEYLRNYKWQD